MKKKLKRLRYVRWGLANSFEDKIELNLHLKKYPLLKKAILKHERGHLETSDLTHEFDPSIWRLSPYLILFIIFHPSTWIDFLPVQYRNKTVIIDKNLCSLYVIILILLIIIRLIYF
jgi:hypothetical protein